MKPLPVQNIMAFVRNSLQQFAAGLAVATALAVVPASAALLIGNTAGNSVTRFDDRSGALLGAYIGAGTGGLSSPDDLTFGPDGNLYVSSSSSPTTGEILRFDGTTGAFISVFAQGGGLARPYGIAFGPDGNLYVASFRSDQILRYDGTTGAFLGVFASGSGTANGLNGPNDLLFGKDGSLYVTTQGSVADGLGGITYQFDSQVLRYDSAGHGSVFATPTVPAPGGAGFVSLLGLAFGPDGLLYTSDFAGGLRSYDGNGALVQTIATDNLFPGNPGVFLGNLGFGPDGAVYVSAFAAADPLVAGVARCEVTSGDCSLFIDGSGSLARPIGLAFTPGAVAVPEPATVLLLALGLSTLAMASRHRTRV